MGKGIGFQTEARQKALFAQRICGLKRQSRKSAEMRRRIHGFSQPVGESPGRSLMRVSVASERTEEESLQRGKSSKRGCLKKKKGVLKEESF